MYRSSTEVILIEAAPTETALLLTTETDTPTPTPTITPTLADSPIGPIVGTPTPTPTLIDSAEPNGGCVQAQGIPTDGQVNRYGFFEPGDQDWVRFNARANETYRIEVQSPYNSRADVNLQVYPSCEEAPTQDSQPSFTAGIRLDIEMQTDSTVYMRLSNQNRAVFGTDVFYDISVRPLHNKEVNGAAIILGGRFKLVDNVQPNIDNVTDDVYRLFKDNGYSDDEIFYMSTDAGREGYDKPATNANLQEAITQWAVDKVGQDQPLTLYLMDHGHIDKFYIDQTQDQVLDPTQLNAWLNELEAQVPDLKINVIIEACNSGSFIQRAKSVSKPGRLVITSTNEENVAYASRDGAQFSDRFLTSLREGYSLTQSFWEADATVRQLNSIQRPWIDANGDGFPDLRTDRYQVDDHEAGTDRLTGDTWAPYIVWAKGPLTLDEIADGSGTIEAEVRDNKAVDRVWVAVYGPSYVAPQSSQELIPENVPTFELEPQGDNIFTGTYDGFDEVGTYRLAIYAQDSDELKARLMVLEVPGNGTLFGGGGVTSDEKSLFLPIIQR